MTTTSIGNLNAKLTADTASFVKGMDAAEKKTVAFSSKFKSSLTASAGALSGLNSATGGALASSNALFGGLTRVAGALAVGGPVGVAIAGAAAAWGYFAGEQEKAEEASRKHAEFMKTQAEQLALIRLRIDNVGKSATESEKSLIGFSRALEISRKMSEDAYQQAIADLTEVDERIASVTALLKKKEEQEKRGNDVSAAMSRHAKTLAELEAKRSGLLAQTQGAITAINQKAKEQVRLVDETNRHQEKTAATARDIAAADAKRAKALAAIMKTQAQRRAVDEMIVGLQDKIAGFGKQGADAALHALAIEKRRATSMAGMTDEQRSAAEALYEQLRRQIESAAALEAIHERDARIQEAKLGIEKELADEADRRLKIEEDIADLNRRALSAQQGASVGRNIVGSPGEFGGAPGLGFLQKEKFHELGNELATSIDQAVFGDFMGAFTSGIGAMIGNVFGMAAAGAQIGTAVAGFAGEIVGMLQQAAEMFIEQVNVLMENLVLPLFAGSEGASKTAGMVKKALATFAATIVVAIGTTLMFINALLSLPAIIFTLILAFATLAAFVAGIPVMLVGAMGGLAAAMLFLAQETESAGQFADLLNHAFSLLIDAAEPLFEAMLPLAVVAITVAEGLASVVSALAQVGGVAEFLFGAVKFLGLTMLRVATTFAWLIGVDTEELEAAFDALEALTYDVAAAKAQELLVTLALADTIKGINEEFNNLPPGYAINLATYRALTGGNGAGGSSSTPTLVTEGGQSIDVSATLGSQSAPVHIGTANFYSTSGAVTMDMEHHAMLQTGVSLIGSRLVYQRSVNG